MPAPRSASPTCRTRSTESAARPGAPQNRGRGDRINIAGVDYTVLKVESDTRLYLVGVYAGATATVNYTISRKFTTPAIWADCVDGPGLPAGCEGVTTSSLVTDDRVEVGIMYADSEFTSRVVIAGQTDATHTITLTADGSNRHYGVAGAGVVIDPNDLADCNANPLDTMQVDANHVTLEWLEIQDSGDDAIVMSPSSSTNRYVVRNNIIRFPDCPYPTGGSEGIDMDLSALATKTINADIYNNVVTEGRRNILIENDMTAASVVNVFNNTTYNCTLGTPFGCGIGISGGATTYPNLTIRNNIAHTGPGIVMLYTFPGATSSNNITSDATGEIPNVLLAALSFVDSANGDFHIQPGSTAEDAAFDLSSTFSIDFDNQIRSGSWDIGADEIAATALFRSIGITATALTSGAGNALTISGSTATFGSGLPANIGVGDAIQYDSDGNGSIDAIAFIHGRTDSQTYAVKDKNGAAPAAVIGDNDWTTYRAYTSLSNWQAQDENDTIDDSVENFDISRDLVAGGAVMEAACYNDGPMNDRVDVTGWTTGPRNYVRIFSPAASYLVGAAQRHTGVAGSGFVVRPTLDNVNTAMVTLSVPYARVEGLELDGSNITNVRYARGVRVLQGLTNVGDIRIDSMLIHDLHTTQAGYPWEGSMGIITFQDLATAGPPLLITNNIVYDITNTVLEGHIAGIQVGSRADSYVYNNTVYNIQNDGNGAISGPAWGIYAKESGAGTVTAYLSNNYVGLVDAPLDPGLNWHDYDSESGAALVMNYNISSDGTADDFGGSFNVVGQSTYGSYFVNEGTRDLHLQNTSAALWGRAGDDLSATFNHDIDLEIRPLGAGTWDIGADRVGGHDGGRALVVRGLSRGLRGGASLADRVRAGEPRLPRSPLARVEAGPWERVTSSLIPGLGSSPEGASYSWTDTGLANGTRYLLPPRGHRHRLGLHLPRTGLRGTPCPPPGGGEDGGGEPGAPAPAPGPPGATEPPPSGRDAPGLRDLLPRGRPLPLRRPRGALLPGPLPLRTRGHRRARDPGLRRHPRTRRAECRCGGLRLPHPHPRRRPPLQARPPRRRRRTTRPPRLRRDPRRALLPRPAARVPRHPRGRHPTRRHRATPPTPPPGRARHPQRPPRPHRRRRLHGPRQEARSRAPSPPLGSRSEPTRPLPHPPRPHRLRRRRPGGERLRVLRTTQSPAPKDRTPGLRPLPHHPEGAPRRRLRGRLPLATTGGSAVRPASGPGRTRRPLPRRALPDPSSGPGRSSSSTPTAPPRPWTTPARSPGPSSAPPAARRWPQGPPLPPERLWPPPPTPRPASRLEKIYQSGLLDAPDIWLWDFVYQGLTKNLSLSLEGVDTTSPLQARVRVYLQGASDSAVTGEHHITASWNGVLLDDVSFERKLPHTLEGTVPAASLTEGTNTLTLTNVGDTGVSSLVFLDKVEIDYPQLPAVRAGRFSGAWTEDGAASRWSGDRPRSSST